MPTKKVRWPPRTMIDHVRRTRRTILSPPNPKIASARATTWLRQLNAVGHPSAPRTGDFKKVMESPCPFHPKRKQAAKDCFTLKKYVEEHSKHPACDQDGSDQNKD